MSLRNLMMGGRKDTIISTSFLTAGEFTSGAGVFTSTYTGKGTIRVNKKTYDFGSISSDDSMYVLNKMYNSSEESYTYVEFTDVSSGQVVKFSVDGIKYIFTCGDTSTYPYIPLTSGTTYTIKILSIS